mgnify:FL=1
MPKLVLQKNEYTVKGLLQYLQKTYRTKTNGVPFSIADIHDWAMKKKMPKNYGGQYICVHKIGPLKVLELQQEPFKTTSKELQIETA